MSALRQTDPDAATPRSGSTMPSRIWGVVLGSRLALFLVAAAATASFGIDHVYVYAATTGSLPHGLATRLFEPWTNWDGQQYIRLANVGYHGLAGPAFFPLYVLLVRATTPLAGGVYAIAGVAVSLACYAAAMWLLYRLVALDFEPRVAGMTVAYISLFPMAFFFQAVYTESLFLLLVVGCLYCARRDWWWAAGLVGYLAALTRNTGVLLMVPMALVYAQQRGWTRRRIDVRLAALLLPVGGLLTWMAWLDARYGNAFAFADAQKSWRRSLSAPWTTFAAGALDGARGAAALVQHGLGVSHALPNTLALATLVYAVVVLAAGARRLPLAWTVYGAVALLVPLCFPTPDQPLYSLPRFALVDFPLFMALAVVTARHTVTRWAVLCLSSALLIVLTGLFAHFTFVS